VLEGDERSAEQVRSRINLLLAAAYNSVKRDGSLASGLQFDPANVNQLVAELSERPRGQVVQLQTVSLRNSDVVDPVAVQIRAVSR
jgi:hypothetical protein